MGIPRLTSHLATFQRHTTLGCTNSSCSHHIEARKTPRLAVIDGPGLAYLIYYKLLGRNGASSAIEAQPSYSELGAAVVSSLRFFASCGFQVEHVYFDGALPTTKRVVRAQRLADTLSKLNVYRDVHASGFKMGTAKPVKLRGEEIFYPWAVPTFAKNLPSSSFLVPAVFEALKDSEFADRTQLVPGEADSYLAEATRSSQHHLCLTGDSDLAIHDLGAGSLAFFTSLEALSCSKCNHGHALVAKTLQQEDLLRKIGPEATATDLMDLGFELHQDHTLGFEEAVRRVKVKTSAASKARACGLTKVLDEFGKDYLHHVDLNSLSDMPEWCQLLDNRTSELVVQALSKDKNPWHHYLLPLIEDPQRRSAWSASQDIRQLAYSILVYRTRSKARAVIEICRSGWRIVETTVPVLSEDEASHALELLTHLSQRMQDEISELSIPAHYSIMFAAMRAYYWYLEEGRTPPGPELIQSALGKHRAGKLTWESMHLRAQIHGIAFAMRMLNQILLAPVHAGGEHLTTQKLHTAPIRDIILSDSELRVADLSAHVALIVSMARSSHTQGTTADTDVTKGDRDPTITKSPETQWEPASSRSRSKRKRNRAEKASSGPKEDPRQIKSSKNPFDLLR